MVGTRYAPSVGTAVLLVVGTDPGITVVTFDNFEGNQVLVLLGQRIIEPAPDQALDRKQGVGGVGDRLALGRRAHKARAVLDKGDDRRRRALAPTQRLHRRPQP